jgi:hypothetical protein
MGSTGRECFAQKVVKAIREFSARSAGMSLARRFNAGESINLIIIVASRRLNLDFSRRYAT